MKGSSLAVYVSGAYCGELTENRYGALSFAYDRGYDGVPLSLSMPVGLARYGDRVVRPYLMGLLPDNQETRVAIGAPFGVSGDNPFRLLRIVGRDCPGAIQILEESDPVPAEDSTSDLIALSEGDVERRLAEVRAPRGHGEACSRGCRAGGRRGGGDAWDREGRVALGSGDRRQLPAYARAPVSSWARRTGRARSCTPKVANRGECAAGQMA